jgi:alkylation response protein AidB-like acyl-CoA dehydrogenase
MTISLDGRSLPEPAAFPPYPATDRQAEFMALGDELAAIAAEHADEHDRNNSFPRNTFEAIRAAGYHALTVPEEFGGRGASPLEAMLAQERLSRGSGSVGLAINMHLVVIGGLAETRAWPAGLFADFCGQVVNEGALVNTAASEPELGSPSRGGAFATRATWTENGWLINGRKSWTTHSPALTHTIVQLTVEERDGTLARANMLVPMSTPGVHVDEGSWDNMSMRSSGSNDVVYENVLVPHEARIGVPALAQAKASGWSLLSSAVYLGIATAARDFAVQFAKERVPSGLGRPIAELPNVQQRVAELEILLFQARSALYQTIETFERFPEHREGMGWQLAAAKYTVTNLAVQITDLALRTTGSNGLLRKYALERYFRDARAGLGNPPIDDVALSIIGKHALGAT